MRAINRIPILVSLALLHAAALGAQSVPRQLTLAQALEIAAARHADLEAAEAAIDARRGAERQASYSPNPTLYLQSENWRFWGSPSFSASQDLELFAFVSQAIETGGKKQRRVELARRDRRLAELRRQALLWRIQQGVRRAYWQVLAARNRQRLLGASIENFTQIVDFHEKRVRLGAMAEADLIKVRLEGERITVNLSSAKMETERAKFALLEAMGLPEVFARFTVREEPLPAPSANWAAVREQLTTAAMEHRYEVQLAEAFVERTRSLVGLEKAAARPNVTPYFGYKRSIGFDTLVGGVTVPLPLFDRNAGRIEETTAEVRQNEARLRGARTRVRAEVAAALAAVMRREEMLSAMETGMLDRASETSQIAVAAYQEGGADLFRLLDAQRAHNEIELLHSGLMFDYKLSRIDLETAVGTESLPISQGVQRAANQ